MIVTNKRACCAILITLWHYYTSKTQKMWTVPGWGRWETCSHKWWQDITHDQHNPALDKDVPHLPFKGFQYPMHDSGSHYVILTMPQTPPGQLHELVCCSQDDLKLKSSLESRLKKEQKYCHTSKRGCTVWLHCAAMCLHQMSAVFDGVWMTVISPGPNASDLLSLMETAF